MKALKKAVVALIAGGIVIGELLVFDGKRA